MRIIKHLLEYLTLCVLVRVYWVECYLRSNTQIKEIANDKDRELDIRDTYHLKLDDFYHEENHHYNSEDYYYDHHDYSEDHRGWSESEDNEENHRYPSKYGDDNFDYFHRSHVDDFESNQLDADSWRAYFHDDGDGIQGDDWSESAQNRLNDYKYDDDDDDKNLASG